MKKVISVLLLMIPVCATAQFEVASIRPDDNNAAGSMHIEIHDGGLFSATAASIKMLIRNAFDIPSFQLEGGPVWMDSVKYDVNAKTGDSVPLTRERLKSLLQTLLAERFGFRYHREYRDLTSYSLLAGKGGAKFAASKDEGAPSINGSNNAGNAQVTVTRVSMADLARELAGQLQTVVQDDTQMKGIFDFTLKWSFNPGPDAPNPSIFTAIQDQLGLRLEAHKGPVEIIVIDHIDRTPTDN